MKRIKLLFVAEELIVNGATMSLLALLNALPKDRYEVNLFVMEHGGCLMSRVPDHVRVLPERLCYSVHRLPLKIALRKAVKKGRLDLAFYRILVSFQRAFKLDYCLWPFLTDITDSYDVVCSYEDGFTVPMIIKKVKHGKKCSWIHIPFSHCPQLPYVLAAFDRVDACVPVSNYVGKDLTAVIGHQTSPHFLVHNIIDADSCISRSKEACEYPKRDFVKRIVSVGRITSAKGFDIIPKIAMLLEQKGIDFEWIIIGDGADRMNLQNEANNLCHKKQVMFVGSKDNPMPWVKSADVVVQPSTFESWGMMVSEALCLGKALVVSDIPAFREQITDGVNGLIRKYEPSAMADAIENVLLNNDLQCSLEDNASSYPFTKEVVIKEFDNLIGHVLNDNNI